MILEIKIPDEIYEQYNRSADAIAKQLVDTVNLDPNPNLHPFYFNEAQLSELRRFFGPNIRNSENLVALIKRVGTIRLQETASYQLDSDQTAAMVEQAYFLSEQGDPTDRSDERFSAAAHSKVVQRHVQIVLTDALNYILGVA